MTHYKKEIAGLVTLYNSSLEVLENIKTYLNQIDKLYVVDNSEFPNSKLVGLIKSLANVDYIPNNDNLGIGYALNMAANKAIEDGYLFLLTMDDDSKSSVDLVSKMLFFLNTYKLDSVGIVSVSHSIKHKDSPYAFVLYTMTSGNLLNLYAYKLVGPFNEELFIDHVDHEYCLRLNRLHFKVVELPGLFLDHKLGSKKQFKILNEFYSFISHSPQRMYYMTRNGIYVALRYLISYPQFLLTVLRLIISEMIKAVLFEDQKLLRCKNIFKGIKDGLLGQLGRIEGAK